ncbi:DUF2304 domain-containing protein [Stomatohabitans albus]|uniref:DUF2304 domain-containing protein n=1 Tax=Stomatohabitans albus TaxID=3110766 RepID=UPI00300C6C80
MAIQLIALSLAVVVLLVSFGLVRQGRIREKYALQWILLGLVSVVLALFPNLLNALASVLGIADPPNLLIFLGVWFLIGVIVHLTLETNKLEERVRVLAEEIALLKATNPNKTQDKP